MACLINFLSGQKDQSTIDTILTDLVRLLPSANRDTLFMTLQCLRKVADNAMDQEDSNGNIVSEMSNFLAA